MVIDNVVPVTIIKSPLPEFLTFHCDRNVLADLHNDEGCIKMGGLTEHTYPLVMQVGANLMGIAGYIECSVTGSGELVIETQNNGDWEEVGTIPFLDSTLTPFEFYIPRQLTKFRFRTLGLPKIHYSEGILHFGDTPIDQISTQGDCEAIGCHWWGDRCHLVSPLCTQLNTQLDCERFNCYWALGECRPLPTACRGWLTEADCVAAGCEWWGPEHPYDPDTCHESGIQVARLSLDPDEPADIYSSTPVGSDWAEFDLGQYAEVKRGIGVAMIYDEEGGNGVSEIMFRMDNLSDMSQNRKRTTWKWYTDFDEDYMEADERKRKGNIFKVGSFLSFIKIGYCYMLLYYKQLEQLEE